MANTSLESGPAIRAVAITPSDTANIGDAVALYIGTAGTLQVTTQSGDICAFGAVSAGLLPLKVTRVWASNTNASNIVALY